MKEWIGVTVWKEEEEKERDERKERRKRWLWKRGGSRCYLKEEKKASLYNSP